MKKLFSLFLATTALWASSASENIGNDAMRTTPLMIVALAKILPLYHKTIMISSSKVGSRIVFEGHVKNWVKIENLKDGNGLPVKGKMVISMADLQGISSKLSDSNLSAPKMSSLTDLHITGSDSTITRHIKKFSDQNQGRNLSIIFTTDVTSIGGHFLYYCSGLNTLNLSPLSNLTKIGNYFLSGCTGLNTLDLSRLSNVTKIGDLFLSNCSGLTTLDLLPLSNTGFIWDFFLSGCSGLTKLDLSPLSKMNNILVSFIHAYSSLTRLDLSRLPNVTNIGDSFLVGCTGLENLTVSAESPLAKQITEGQKNGQISSSLEIQLVVG